MQSLKSSKHIKYDAQSNSYYGSKTNLNRWVFSLDVKELRVSADRFKDLHKQIRSKCENIQGSGIHLQVSVTIVTPSHNTHKHTHARTHAHRHTRTTKRHSIPFKATYLCNWLGGGRGLGDCADGGRWRNSWQALPFILDCSPWQLKLHRHDICMTR